MRSGQIQRAEALNSARELLRVGFGAAVRDPVAGEILLQEDRAEEYPHAWSVPFNSRRYLDDGDTGYAMVPCVIVVPKDSGPAHYAPSATPLADYLATIAPDPQPDSGTADPS